MQIEETYAKRFAEALSFQTFQPAVFPTVERVTVYPYNDFIIDCCPNTTNLSGFNFSHSRPGKTYSETPYILLSRARSLKQLTSLTLYDTVTAELMEALYDAVPNISTIVLQSNSRYFGMKFEELLDHIIKFQSLQILSLPGITGLGVGYDPHLGSEGAEPSKLSMQRREIEDRLARMLLGEIGGRCKRLNEVGFGSSRCRIKGNEEGKKELDWWVEESEFSV
ncbi:hypothetical protein VKT23_007418 [Stygiomarasmius scandens]|uniref:Uncharacterized protein n=1 Tax=Marasmiellus scandens TaxID=2682957 RepID=A0ABR1JN28_9AGAR